MDTIDRNLQRIRSSLLKTLHARETNPPSPPRVVPEDGASRPTPGPVRPAPRIPEQMALAQRVWRRLVSLLGL